MSLLVRIRFAWCFVVVAVVGILQCLFPFLSPNRQNLLAFLCLLSPRLRRRRLLRFLSLDSFTDRELPFDASATPEERAEVQKLYRFLDGLPAEERVAWLMRHVEGESLDAMVVLCGCSKSTVQRRLQRAEARLRALRGETP